MSDVNNELRDENFIFLKIMDIFTIGEHNKFEFEDLYICIYNLIKKDLIKKINFDKFSIKSKVEKDAKNSKKPKDNKDHKLDLILKDISEKTIYELKNPELDIIKVIIDDFIKLNVDELMKCFKKLKNLNSELCRIGFLNNILDKINIITIIEAENKKYDKSLQQIYRYLELNKKLPLIFKQLLDIANTYEKEFCSNVIDLQSERKLQFSNLLYQTYIDNTNIDFNFSTNITEKELNSYNPYFYDRFNDIIKYTMKFFRLDKVYNEFMKLPYLVKFCIVVFIIYILSNIINIQFSMNK